MVRYCCLCTENRAIIKRPKTAEMICKDCFYRVFEDEVHQTIVENKLFHRGERVAIAASGGKGALPPSPPTSFFSFFLFFCSLRQLRYLLTRRERVSSDSTVLAHVLTTLNARHDYGLDLFLLSIDEGITGYRDDSLEVPPFPPLSFLDLFFAHHRPPPTTTARR